MCGIVGYTGHRQALGVVVEGLSRLEYRGYDSAGVAVLSDSQLAWVKRAGKLGNLKSALAQGPPMPGTVGLGHTRWATHGPPTDPNAHPHTDSAGRLAVVHNGIIENFAVLRTELEAGGHGRPRRRCCSRWWPRSRCRCSRASSPRPRDTTWTSRGTWPNRSPSSDLPDLSRRPRPPPGIACVAGDCARCVGARCRCSATVGRFTHPDDGCIRLTHLALFLARPRKGLPDTPSGGIDSA